MPFGALKTIERKFSIAGNLLITSSHASPSSFLPAHETEHKIYEVAEKVKRFPKISEVLETKMFSSRDSINFNVCDSIFLKLFFLFSV